MFSKACEYGIRASIYIAQQSLLDRKVSLKEISEAIESPTAYTSKILQKLSRNIIINADKGPCPVHNQFKVIREELKKMSDTTTIKSLAIDFENGLTFLKR